MNIMAQMQAFLAGHLWASMAMSALMGAGFWHQALTWIETTGVDQAVAWVNARQVAAAKAMGFTDAQIAALQAVEQSAAQRAADDLKPTNAPPAA